MITNKFQFKIFTEDFDDHYRKLRENLINYNISITGTYVKKEHIFLGYFDDQNRLIACLYGYLLWGMLYIDLLWVEENYRKQKIGSKLLIKTEEYAAEKKVLYIRVNTASFQALDFYLKSGYETFAKLPLSIEENVKQYDYYLVKYLKQQA